MGSKSKWRRQRKESINLKIQQKLPNLNSRKKRYQKQTNNKQQQKAESQGSNIGLIGVPEGKEKKGQVFKITIRNNGLKPSQIWQETQYTDSRS